MPLSFLRSPSLASLLTMAALGATTALSTAACSSNDDGGGAANAGPGTGTDDAGTDPGETPDPATQLVGEPGAWTWNAVEGAKCGNGAPTGVGVNLGTSDRLVIFFEGGGACWNGLTCFAAKTAAYVDTGFGEAEFGRQFTDAKTKGSFFDRTIDGNVFKDDTFVYIPYCTGDVHAGAKVTTYDNGDAVHHVGRTNAELVLEKVLATWKGKVNRVIASGSSAGGFGAAIHYGRIAEAFAPTRVDLLDDSGPPFPAAKTPYLAQWDASWDLFNAFPADCDGCKSDPAAVVPYYSQKYPSSRIALLSYDRDGVISRFYSMTADEFKTNIEAVATALEPLPNARTFLVKGTEHTMLRELDTESGGTTVGEWVKAMVTDGSDWASVKAAP